MIRKATLFIGRPAYCSYARRVYVGRAQHVVSMYIYLSERCCLSAARSAVGFCSAIFEGDRDELLVFEEI